MYMCNIGPELLKQHWTHHYSASAYPMHSYSYVYSYIAGKSFTLKCPKQISIHTNFESCSQLAMLIVIYVATKMWLSNKADLIVNSIYSCENIL